MNDNIIPAKDRPAINTFGIHITIKYPGKTVAITDK